MKNFSIKFKLAAFPAQILEVFLSGYESVEDARQHFITLVDHSEIIKIEERRAAPDYKGHDSLADMIKGHVHNWRTALEAEKKGYEDAMDSDNASYIDHELKALAEIEAATLVELELSKG